MQSVFTSYLDRSTPKPAPPVAATVPTSLLYKWCVHIKAVVLGGTAVDLNLRENYKEQFYPDNLPGDLDVCLAESKLEWAVIELEKMLSPTPPSTTPPSTTPPSTTPPKLGKDKKGEEKEEKEGHRVSFKYVALIDDEDIDLMDPWSKMVVTTERKGEVGRGEGEKIGGAMGRVSSRGPPLKTGYRDGIVVRILVDGAVSAEVGLVADENMEKIPTTALKSGLLVMSLEAALSSYCAVLSLRKLLNHTRLVEKVVRYIIKIGSLMKKHKLLPSPLKIDPKDSKVKLADALKTFPLPPDCYYAGQTALNLLQGKYLYLEEKAGVTAATIEIACFRGLEVVVNKYIASGKYNAYQMDYDWRWATRASKAVLEPSKKTIPTLIIYDMTHLCSQAVGPMLSPMAVAGFCGTNVCRMVISTLLDSADMLAPVLAREEYVGTCAYGPYLAKIGAKYGVAHGNTLSTSAYFASCIRAMQDEGTGQPAAAIQEKGE